MQVAAERGSLGELPSVDALLRDGRLGSAIDRFGRDLVREWARRSLAELRERLRDGDPSADRNALIDRAVELVLGSGRRGERAGFTEVINAAGVVLHTNLGRAPLADAAIEAAARAARYANL